MALDVNKQVFVLVVGMSGELDHVDLRHAVVARAFNLWIVRLHPQQDNDDAVLT